MEIGRGQGTLAHTHGTVPQGPAAFYFASSGSGKQRLVQTTPDPDLSVPQHPINQAAVPKPQEELSAHASALLQSFLQHASSIHTVSTENYGTKRGPHSPPFGPQTPEQPGRATARIPLLGAPRTLQRSAWAGRTRSAPEPPNTSPAAGTPSRAGGRGAAGRAPLRQHA